MANNNTQHIYSAEYENGGGGAVPVVSSKNYSLMTIWNSI